MLCRKARLPESLDSLQEGDVFAVDVVVVMVTSYDQHVRSVEVVVDELKMESQIPNSKVSSFPPK